MVVLLCLASSCTGSKTQSSDVLLPRSNESFFSTEECLIIHSDSVQNMARVDDGSCITIDLPDCSVRTRLDTVFSSYRFIPLESGPDCMIGQVTRLVKCKDCFCVFDRGSSNVFLFNLDGSFRCKLGKKGHTKKEYLNVWNVAYNEQEDFISLLDLDGRKILNYDLEGTLQGVVPLYFLFLDMEYDGDYIVFNTDHSHNTFSPILDCHQLTVGDRSHKPVAHTFPFDEENRDAFSYSMILKKYGNIIYCDDLISDTLWSIHGTQMKPLVTFRSDGARRFSREEMSHMTDQLFEDRNKRIRHCFEWMIMPDYMIFSIAHPSGSRGLVYYLIYSRESRRYKACGKVKEFSRLGDFVYSSYMDTWDENSFVSVVEPIHLLGKDEDPRFVGKLTAEEKALLSNLSEDSNPLLLITTIQEF